MKWVPHSPPPKAPILSLEGERMPPSPRKETGGTPHLLPQGRWRDRDRIPLLNFIIHVSILYIIRVSRETTVPGTYLSVPNSLIIGARYTVTCYIFFITSLLLYFHFLHRYILVVVINDPLKQKNKPQKLYSHIQCCFSHDYTAKLKTI